ncbi:hypothetical protein BH10CYA1_BH10CYA1_43480 [soil metagenome]
MTARILVLLEDLQTMRLVASSLEQVGHVAQRANNYEDARQILRQYETDLILADVHLQDEFSIFDFMRWVKGDPHLKAIPLVCSTQDQLNSPNF